MKKNKNFKKSHLTHYGSGVASYFFPSKKNFIKIHVSVKKSNEEKPSHTIKKVISHGFHIYIPNRVKKRNRIMKKNKNFKKSHLTHYGSGVASYFFPSKKNFIKIHVSVKKSNEEKPSHTIKKVISHGFHIYIPNRVKEKKSQTSKKWSSQIRFTTSPVPWLRNKSLKPQINRNKVRKTICLFFSLFLKLSFFFHRSFIRG